MNFKDHFSKQSGLYLRYRPHYPPDLFAWLSSLTVEHLVAWDCGTGNGQSAVGLAPYFASVMATDPSEAQINLAIPCEGVTYRVEKAEHSSLPDAGVDIITIANALHWLHWDSFYPEVRRVVKPGGVIAAWAYQLPVISDEVDAVIHDLHYKILDAYWLPENRLVERGYADIPFPFESISAPSFYCEKQMTLDDVVGYLNTWSATQRYKDQQQRNPVEEISGRLTAAWGYISVVRNVRWNLILKAGKVHA